jgi:hypothetical protein
VTFAKAVRPIAFTAFCSRVLALTLTRGQRVLCAVAFDGIDPADLLEDDRELARQMFGDVDEVPSLARRVLCLTLGRNSGKSTLASAYGLWRMVTADVRPAGPGDIPIVVVIAPGKRTAGHDVRMALGLVQGSRELRSCIESETSDGFVLRRPADGRLVGFEAFAASRGGASARGRSVLSAVLDEAQFFQSDSEFVVTDRDVFAGIIPRLMADGAAVFISTIWPTPTMMGELHDKNFGAPSTALAALAPTLLMRDGDEAIAALVAAERERDPENAAREFDCDDSATAGSIAFFDPQAIRACVDNDLILPQPQRDGVSVSFGADLAFARDSSTLVGCAENPIEVVAIEELRPSKGNPLRPRAVIDSFAATVSRYGSSGFTADIHYKESAREHLEPHHLDFRDAPGGRDGKTETYLHAKKLIHEARVRLPNHARLIAQLRSIVSKPAPGGGLTIAAPRRIGLGHGDLVSGLVLALWAVKDGEQPRWVRAMAEIENRENILAYAQVETSISIYGAGTYAATIEGLRGSAHFEQGERQPRFSHDSEMAFRTRIMQWWISTPNHGIGHGGIVPGDKPKLYPSYCALCQGNIMGGCKVHVGAL